MDTNRKWLSKLTEKDTGFGFYKFYIYREFLDSWASSLLFKIEEIEKMALNAQFEEIDKNLTEFIEKDLVKKDQHFKKLLGIKETSEGNNT